MDEYEADAVFVGVDVAGDGEGGGGELGVFWSMAVLNSVDVYVVGLKVECEVSIDVVDDVALGDVECDVAVCGIGGDIELAGNGFYVLVVFVNVNVLCLKTE